MNNQKKTFLNNTHFVILIPVLVCILALAVALFIKPVEVSGAIESFKANALNAMAPFYLWLGLGVVVFCLFIAFSKYGNVRLGAEKPEFSTFSWIAMMFCAGMGSSLMYWSAAEWVYYMSTPPQGVEPFSQQAQELAMVYGSYHWGITPWALYVVGAIALGVRYYLHKKPELSLSACCAAVIGEKRVNTLTGRIIDIIFILGLLAGQACTLAFGTPMICEMLHRVLGIERSFAMTVIVMCVVTMIFMITSWAGIGKGMKNVSTYTAYAAIAIAIFFLIAGPTMYELKHGTQMFGYQLQNFIGMSTWTDPIGNSGFPESWTAFYWAWWLALGPWVWVYAARVSKGRTLRQMIMGMVLCGTAGDWLYFTTVSPTGLWMQNNGIVDLVTEMTQKGPEYAVASLVENMPFGSILMVIWIFVAVFLLSTTYDSVTFTIAATTAKRLSEGEEPNRMYRLLLAGVIIATPLGFLFADAPLSAVQSAAFLTAIPIGVLCIFSMVSAIKYLKRDFGDMSSEQIIQACNDPNFVPRSVLEEKEDQASCSR